MTTLARLVASVFYAGYCPVAPGTAGSAVAVIVYWLLPQQDVRVASMVLIGLILIGVWASTLTEKERGRDASLIVIDEFAGVFVSLFLLPKTWPVFLAGFFLFRFFDIFKPFPIRQAERLKGGLGVMADDVLAGICTNIVLRLCIRIFS